MLQPTECLLFDQPLITPPCPMAQWKDKARAAEAEVQKLQSQLAHVEHASRAQELTLDQLKGRLTDKVTREERLAKRDAEAYARLKRAFLSTKGSHLFCHRVAYKMHTYCTRPKTQNTAMFPCH